MFIGREYEIGKLEEYYKSDKFEFIVMYGRRRVGKTTILNELVKNKKNLYIAGEEFNEKTTLENFTKALIDYFDLPKSMPNFSNYKDIFDFIIEKAENERLVLILDEFQYIASTNNGFLSFLQNIIDQKLIKTKIFMIVCGSSVSFMENEVLAYKSPLFGRRTAQFEINPFGIYEVAKFFENYNKEDIIKAYAILGGTPQYLIKFDDKLTIEENLKKNILDKSSYLFDEAKNILKQELREVNVYNSIIQAIASGYTKINEIATKIGEERDKVSKYVKVLREIRIIKREISFGEDENTKKSYYKISDNYFLFYYRFVYKNLRLIEQGKIDYLYKDEIEIYFSDYIGHIFEEVCKEYLNKKNRNDETPFVIANIGNWWGNNKEEKKQEEIDIVGNNRNKYVFAECKWKNEKMKLGVYKDLVRKSELVTSTATEKYYYLFSKSGFEEALMQESRKDKKIQLISLEDII
ncbi:MAG TPA: ATPase [Clostridiales bacterium]|nr:MAG: ATPase [Clostridiales bacterium GWD2_32_59]HAN09139.1 ATPase [Clostridiales bacterium]